MAELKMCSLRSSSQGNATVIYNDEMGILVDCGISGKLLESCLEEAGIDPKLLSALVVTHEHTDHIKGVGVVARKLGLPVFATYGTWNAMLTAVGELPEGCRRVIGEGIAVEIAGVKVTAFPIPHDAAHPVGYVFETEDDKVAVVTDIGIMTDEIFDAIKGSRTVLLESNYELFMLEAGPYPYHLRRRIAGDMGHLCNDDAALVARDLAKTGTRNVILGHISPENNYPDIAYQSAKNCLEAHGFKVGEDVFLSVAKRDGIVFENSEKADC